MGLRRDMVWDIVRLPPDAEAIHWPHYGAQEVTAEIFTSSAGTGSFQQEPQDEREVTVWGPVGHVGRVDQNHNGLSGVARTGVGCRKLAQGNGLGMYLYGRKGRQAPV